MKRQSYRLAEYRIDPGVRELWRAGNLVPLPPHVFDCLAYLIEHRDRAVGRDELVASVWGKTEVSDTLLGQTILRVRRELGDDGKEQRVVRTIPRFGYRWIALVETNAGEPVAASVTSIAATPALPADRADGAGMTDASSAAAVGRPGRIPARLVAFALVGVLALLGLLVLFLPHQQRLAVQPTASTPNSGLVSAGVFPAEVNADSEWSWLRLGLMDVVATRLRTSGLPTVPSENIIALLARPSGQRSGSVRETAGFDWLITPHASRSGGLWHVHLDADDGAGQRHGVDASAAEPTEAARRAASALLVALGREVADVDSDAAPYAQLIRHVDAAILADDPAAARALIEQASPSERASPELRLRLAHIDFRSGRLSAAHDRLVALLDEAPAQTAPVLRAEVLNGLGAVAIRSDDAPQAERFFSEAVDLLATRAEPAQLGQAYMGRAAAAADQRHFEAAAADYARARIALMQANDTLALVRVAANEGFMDAEQGRPAQALPELAQASAGFVQWGALNEAIFTHIGQIGCELLLLEPARAMDVAEAAAPLGARIDNQDTRDSLSIARARALAANGRLREARDLLAPLRAAHPAKGDATAAAAAVALAQMDLAGGNSESAAALAGSAIGTLTQPGYVRLRADGWLVRIRALSRQRDRARAAAELAAFEQWADSTGDGGAAVRVRLAHAEAMRQTGADGPWQADLEKARVLAGQRAIPAEIAMVAAAHADALLADGDLQAAAVEVGRLSRWSQSDFGSAVLEARLYGRLGRTDAQQAALARARTLAGERTIPADAVVTPVATETPSLR